MFAKLLVRAWVKMRKHGKKKRTRSKLKRTFTSLLGTKMTFRLKI